MTDEELRAHWDEGTPTPTRTGPLPTWLILLLVGAALLIVAAVVLPGMSAENERARQREDRVCLMARMMADPTLDEYTAKLLCETP